MSTTLIKGGVVISATDEALAEGRDGTDLNTARLAPAAYW